MTPAGDMWTLPQILSIFRRSQTSIVLNSGVMVFLLLLLIRSYSVEDRIEYTSATGITDLSFLRGKIYARWVRGQVNQRNDGLQYVNRSIGVYTLNALELARTSSTCELAFLGVEVYYRKASKAGRTSTYRFCIVAIPQLFAIVPIGVPLFLRCFRQIRRYCRVRRNCCGNCGYDLRGSVGRCPECGTQIRR